MIENAIKTIKAKRATFSQWILGFTAIILVRFVFESISSATNAGVVASDVYTIMHTWLYFLMVVLGITLIIGHFTKNYSDTIKIVLFGLPVIWLGPILDMIISLGKGFDIGYVRDTGLNLVRDFFTFFGPNLTSGATYGLRLEMAIILIAIGYFVWLFRKNVFESILAALISYIFIFVSFVIPGLIYTLSHIHSPYGTTSEIVGYISKIILHSNISHNTFRDGLSYVSLTRLVEMGFDKLFSQIFFIFSILLATVLLWKIDSKKFNAVVKNMRLNRVIFFLALLGFGMGYAYLGGYGRLVSYIDYLTVACLAISCIGAWMYAVHLNDVEDINIDKISNPERPLINKSLSLDEMKEIGYIWLTVALVGAWAAGFSAFSMITVYVGASYIYSSHPLRLRVVPILSSFLISLACLVTILAGFFFVSFSKTIQTFPISVSLGILIIFTLIINIKDLKDVEGDRADGIHTLPTIFGKDGGRMVGLCFALGILLIPFFLSFYILYITAIPTAIIGYRIISKKPFVEENVFILGFIFFLCSIFLFLGLVWLSRFV